MDNQRSQKEDPAQKIKKKIKCEHQRDLVCITTVLFMENFLSKNSLSSAGNAKFLSWLFVRKLGHPKCGYYGCFSTTKARMLLEKLTEDNFRGGLSGFGIQY